MIHSCSYDTVAYPSATFPQTHPDRLAIIARLHGLDAPPVESARVLEIGGGDGFNVIAVAAAFPDSRFLSFDLSATAVARGQALVAASGLASVRIEQADILEMAEAIEPGAWDYIIAHGVYAWVPGSVREAIMALAGHALAPDGVFFVSYNCRPGGHVRQVMRDMLLHELADVQGIELRMAVARRFLVDFAQPRKDDDSVVAAMRAQAVAMLGRPDAVLFHDELGEVFAPQYLADVAAAARQHGLEFLNDAGRSRMGDGFGAEGLASVSTGEILRAAQSDDFAAMRFFRQSLFVRQGRTICRQPQLATLLDCRAAGQFQLGDDGDIRCGEATFALSDGGLSQWLLDLGSTWPKHRSVREIATDDDRMQALYRLHGMGLLHLTTVPPPFALAAGLKPMASPLVRAQLSLGHNQVTTLHFEQMGLGDAAARGLIALLDGSRDHAQLELEWRHLPHAPELGLKRALDMIANQRLLRA